MNCAQIGLQLVPFAEVYDMAMLRLLADAERAEDAPQQIVGAERAGDLAQVLLCQP